MWLGYMASNWVVAMYKLVYCSLACKFLQQEATEQCKIVAMAMVEIYYYTDEILGT